MMKNRFLVTGTLVFGFILASCDTEDQPNGVSWTAVKFSGNINGIAYGGE